MILPKDPMILLSFINTQLRDFYPSLETFCRENQLDENQIIKVLSAVDYEYNPVLNRFE